MPETVLKCIESWHKYLPDYEFKLWDGNAVKSIDSFFLKEALSVNKWAFAADFIRLYAIYHEGGIWLDTDVELRGSLDAFLNDRCFIGKERFYNLPTSLEAGLCSYLTAHCFGAEVGNPYIKKCLEFYEGRHFIESDNDSLPNDLRFNMTLMPYIMARIAMEYGYNWRPKVQEIQYLPDGLIVYPTSFFDGREGDKNCIAVHHHLGGWYEKQKQECANNKKRSIKSKVKAKLITKVAGVLDHYGFALYRL